MFVAAHNVTNKPQIPVARIAFGEESRPREHGRPYLFQDQNAALRLRATRSSLRGESTSVSW